MTRSLLRRLWLPAFAVLILSYAVYLPAVGQESAKEEGQVAEEASSQPIDAGVEERVEVALAEVHVLVTDKRGNPITDLKPEEITILERGKVQDLAYLDSVSGERHSEREMRETPAPAILFGSKDEAPQVSEVDAVLPAKPVRRVVLVFDVLNSKRKTRDDWKEAALHWVDADMRSEDWVAVLLLRSYPQWLTPFTNQRVRVRQVIEELDIVNAAADRDRSRDMDNLMSDIQSLCTDPRGLRGTTSKTGGVDQNEAGCAYELAEGYAVQWDRESKQTIETLRALSGILASIPGQKVVILFSEGFVSDAAGTAFAAMQGSIRVEDMRQNEVTWRMQKDAYREFGDLMKTAKAGGVSFFTMDTRNSADRGFGGRLEHGSYLNPNNMGVNPWQEMELETRGNLNSLAKETGGRSYHGTGDLENKVTAAANSYFGHYLVGYYRSDPSAPAGKIQLKIDRKKLDIDYPDQPTLWPHRAREIKLDLTLGAPVPTGSGNDRTIPISLMIPFDDLPLRRGSGGRGLQLGVYLQAIRPDGTVAAQQLDVPAVVADKSVRQAAKGKIYMHETTLEVPPGSYRIRARISDDRQEFIADRSVDVTVTEDGLRAGIGKEKPEEQ